MTLGFLFMVERVVTVRKSTWFAKFVAALLIPELIYASFLNIVFLKGVVDILLAQQATWGHEDNEAGEKMSQSILYSSWYSVLVAFVAINTAMYVILAVVKSLPKIDLQKWRRRNYGRSKNPQYLSGWETLT